MSSFSHLQINWLHTSKKNKKCVAETVGIIYIEWDQLQPSIIDYSLPVRIRWWATGLSICESCNLFQFYTVFFICCLCRRIVPVSGPFLDQWRRFSRRHTAPQVRFSLVFQLKPICLICICKLYKNVFHHSTHALSAVWSGTGGYLKRVILQGSVRLVEGELDSDEGARPVGGVSGSRLCHGPDRRPGASTRLPKAEELLHHQHRWPRQSPS